MTYEHFCHKNRRMHSLFVYFQYFFLFFMTITFDAILIARFLWTGWHFGLISCGKSKNSVMTGVHTCGFCQRD